MAGRGASGRHRRRLPGLFMALAVAISGRAIAEDVPAPPPIAPIPSALREAALEERLRQMEERLKSLPDPEEVRRLRETVRDLFYGG